MDITKDQIPTTVLGRIDWGEMFLQGPKMHVPIPSAICHKWEPNPSWIFYLRSKETFSQKLLSNFAIGSHCSEPWYMSGPQSILVNGDGPSWLAQTNSHWPTEAGTVAGTVCLVDNQINCSSLSKKEGGMGWWVQIAIWVGKETLPLH